MSRIIISYRRDDSEAITGRIFDRLSQSFGKEAVFRDIDNIPAGTDFREHIGSVLRASELLVVIVGPRWLGRTRSGRSRIDDPADLVRIEVETALETGLPVIPLLVSNARMPDVARLPETMQPFAFRNAIRIDPGQDFDNHIERLIRAINGTLTAATSSTSTLPTEQSGSPSQFSKYRSPLLVLAALVPLVAAFGGAAIYFQSRPPIEIHRSHWTNSAGEWVVYGVNSQKPAATYYFKPTSLQLFDGKAAYTSRYPLKPLDLKSSPNQQLQAAYEDDEIVIGCKDSVWTIPEKTIYNNANEVISHYKKDDVKSVDLSSGTPIQSGSIIDTAERVFCNERLRTPIADDPTTATTYISPLVGGKSDFYSSIPVKKSDDTYRMLVVSRFYEDQSFSDFFPGQDVVALPHHGYRAFAQPIQLKCGERKIEEPKLEYFDSDNKLQWLTAPTQVPVVDVHDGSPLDMLMRNVCNVSSNDVSGKYEGTNHATLKGGGEGDQKIVVNIEQTGNQIKVNFQTPNGGQGEGTGILEGRTIKTITLKSTAPDCPGSYEGSLNFNDDSSMSWSYQGQDCSGSIEGHGTAKKAKV